MNHQLNIGPTLNHQVGLMLDQCWGSVMNEIPTLGQRWVNIGQNIIRGANVGPMSDSQQSNVGPTSGQPVG